MPANLTESDILLREDFYYGGTLIQVQANGSILAIVKDISNTNVKSELIFGDTANTNELLQTTSSVRPTFNNIFGYGLVDASAAVASAIGSTSFPEVPDCSSRY